MWQWICCICCTPCFVENDRAAIEAKIHRFHSEAGYPRADGPPSSHKGLWCFALLGGGFTVWLVHAQNYEVMRKFRDVQRPFLEAVPV